MDRGHKYDIYGTKLNIVIAFDAFPFLWTNAEKCVDFNSIVGLM